MIVLPMVVSILMPTSQSEAAGEAGLGWWGALGEAAAAAEILKSTGRSGSQPRNFGTCASKLSGETRNSTSFEQVIISTQTGEISQVQLEGLGLKLRL